MSETKVISEKCFSRHMTLCLGELQRFEDQEAPKQLADFKCSTAYHEGGEEGAYYETTCAGTQLPSNAVPETRPARPALAERIARMDCMFEHIQAYGDSNFDECWNSNSSLPASQGSGPLFKPAVLPDNPYVDGTVTYCLFPFGDGSAAKNFIKEQFGLDSDKGLDVDDEIEWMNADWQRCRDRAFSQAVRKFGSLDELSCKAYLGKMWVEQWRPESSELLTFPDDSSEYPESEVDQLVYNQIVTIHCTEEE